MNSFGQYLTRNRFNGIWVTLLLAALANLGLPTFWLALLVFSFITLRRGAQEGLIVFIFGLLPPLIALYFTRHSSAVNNLFFTLPITAGTLLTYIVSVILHRTHSWKRILSLCVYLGFAVILLVFLLNPDVVAWWKNQMAQSMDQMQKLLGADADISDVQTLIDRTASVFTGLIVAYYSLSVILTLLAARWWQARVFNPGGFMPEFLNLSLDRVSGILFALVVIAYLVFQHALALNMIVAAMVPFALVGVSIIHANIKRSLPNKSTLGLILFYIALIFLALYLVTFLAVIGLIDCFYRFKRA